VADAVVTDVAARSGQAVRRLTWLERYTRRHPSAPSWVLVLPGTIWMVLFVGIPLASIAVISFWHSGFAGIVPAHTLENYQSTLFSATFWRIALWTYFVVAVVLFGVIAISYPAAYAIWRVLKDERWKNVVLLLCIVPFWTSYVTRTITWLPMFGEQGVVNQVLIHFHIIKHPLTILLYSPYSMIASLVILNSVFMIGPLYWSMRKIDEDVVSAAATLGATPWRTFVAVVLPVTRPGLMAGALFTVVLGLGEFFTEQVIGGAKHPMLAGLVLNQIYIFQWAGASAVSVVLVTLTLATVSLMFRYFDLRRV
jgi:putative spermidine/putrescine transport system permease protein